MKGKKTDFIALPGTGGHSRLVPSRLCPPLERVAGSFIVKRRKTGFLLRISVEAKYTFFLGENLLIQAGVRRSCHDAGVGLLGCCLD